MGSESLIETARVAVSSRMPELWAWLERWVGIESFTGDHAGCDRMADALGEAFALPGLTLHKLPSWGTTTPCSRRGRSSDSVATM